MAVALMEFRENLPSGIKLTAANLAGALTLGIFRVIYGSVQGQTLASSIRI